VSFEKFYSNLIGGQFSVSAETVLSRRAFKKPGRAEIVSPCQEKKKAGAGCVFI
jgi:hypothetical protein